MSQIYDHYGRLLKRKAGFDSLLEPEEYQVSENGDNPITSAIGSETSYYSETEEKWVDKKGEK